MCGADSGGWKRLIFFFLTFGMEGGKKSKNRIVGGEKWRCFLLFFCWLWHWDENKDVQVSGQ